jgi:hypothetical protein
MTAEREREALRQQMLLRALWRDARSGVLAGWLRDADPAHGLAAYRGNAGGIAERALAAAFPTVAELVGTDSFGALARAFWHAEPPMRGDLAQWGERLPAFIAASEQLADEPYLADVARLDWAVHRAESAADAPPGAAGLEAIGGADPSQVVLQLRPGTALVSSPHPVATIWHAHRSDAADRFAAARAAFAADVAEHALVWRDGWCARVEALAPADAAFTAAVLDRASLASALQHAGPAFEFEPWLLRSLRDGWLVGATFTE